MTVAVAAAAAPPLALPLAAAPPPLVRRRVDGLTVCDGRCALGMYLGMERSKMIPYELS